MRKATLLIKHGDQTEARNALQIVVSDFKKGDQYQAALALLSSLDGRGDEVRARHEESSVRALDAPVIVLDPGHGGEDFGARGAGGLLEKDVALDVAHRVKSILEQEERARVVLTRNDDSFVPLSSRTTIANNSHAALFVSLHANASEAGNLTGLEVYYLDTEGDEAGKLLAERENHASEKGKSPPSDLAMMVSDLIQVGKVEDSVVLARTMESTISQQIQSSTGEPVRKLGVKKAPFYVLVGAHMPCILVEMLFIDNPLDERRLGDPVFREAFAKGVAQGIEKMLSPKKGTRG